MDWNIGRQGIEARIVPPFEDGIAVAYFFIFGNQFVTRIVQQAAAGRQAQRRVVALGLLAALSEEVHGFQLLGLQQARAHAVVDVVGVVGDLVGQVAHLSLQAWLPALDEAVAHAARFAAPERTRDAS